VTIKIFSAPVDGVFLQAFLRKMGASGWFFVVFLWSICGVFVVLRRTFSGLKKYANFLKIFPQLRTRALLFSRQLLYPQSQPQVLRPRCSQDAVSKFAQDDNVPRV
jgi:hypothetical protein